MNESTQTADRDETVRQAAAVSERQESSKTELANKAPVDAFLDFSFVEVLASERRVVETGGSCASCS